MNQYISTSNIDLNEYIDDLFQSLIQLKEDIIFKNKYFIANMQ